MNSRRFILIPDALDQRTPKRSKITSDNRTALASFVATYHGTEFCRAIWAGRDPLPAESAFAQEGQGVIY
jgi:hypothetical protein